MMWLKNGATAMALLVCSGCAAMNTFQTPAVLEPGTVLLSPGIAFGTRAPTKDAALPDGGLIPLGRGLHLHGRVGVLPHVDVGVQVVGLGAVGLDAKAGFRHRSLRVAGNAGLGRGGIESSGLTGYESRTIRTYFGGVFLGYKGAYVGTKIIDYTYRRDAPEANQTYHRVLPSLGVGYAAGERQRARPVLEVNLYPFPDEVVVTWGMGVHIRIGK